MLGNRFVSFLCAGIVLINATTGAGLCQSAELRGSAAASNAAVEDLNREIVGKEIALVRLNAEFQQHYTRPNKWKQRRLTLYNIVGSGIANAGDITLLSQFWKYYRNPGEGLKHKPALEAGLITVMVAYLTLGGLYTAEGMADLSSDYVAHRHKMDAKGICKRVQAIKTDIDSLMESRKKTIAELGNLSSTDQEIASAEEKVLTGLRDQELIEFARLYIDSRKQRVARDITTIGTLAVCATGAFAGALVTLRGVQQVSLKEVGGGGIGFLISGSLLTAAPFLIYGGAGVSGKVAAKKMSDYLAESQNKTQQALASDTEHLNELIANRSSDATRQTASRFDTYKTMEDLLADRKSYLEADRKRQRNDMIESFISYGARGGPQIAFGTLLARAGYHYSSNASKAFHGVAVGATVNEVSWGIWLLDALQKGTRNEMRNYRDGKNPSANPFIASNEKLVKLESWK